MCGFFLSLLLCACILTGAWPAADGFVAPSTPLMTAKSEDLYIVGAGYLGNLVGRDWQAAFPSGTVYGETRSDERHAKLRAAGITPRTRKDRDGQKYANVVFCASPSGNENYPGEVTTAAKELWDGTGGFVFTSSGGIFKEIEGVADVDEDSPVSDSPRAAKLADAEAACTAVGGRVVRLAGLYSLERGPHSFWLTRGEVTAQPDGLLNLLSYEDAASAVVAAVLRGSNGSIYLAADGRPISRKAVCEAALAHPLYSGAGMPAFNVPPGAPPGGGKRYDCSKTQKALDWTPKHDSFGSFMVAAAAAVVIEAEAAAKIL